MGISGIPGCPGNTAKDRPEAASLTYTGCSPCVPTGINIGVSAVKCGNCILHALALPWVAKTSKVNAGDTNFVGSQLGEFAICLKRYRLAAGGGAVSSLCQAPPPVCSGLCLH